MFIAACQTPAANPIKPNDPGGTSAFRFSVKPAPEWSGLFVRDKGWLGGDGIFALTTRGSEKSGASADDTTVIWFSDTILGEIIGDSLGKGMKMINNSIAVLNKGEAIDSVKFIWDRTKDGAAASVFIPKTPATGKDDYLWLGDGFVNHKMNNEINIFGYRIRNEKTTGTFGFRETGNVLITVPANARPPFKNYKQADIPFFLNKNLDSTGSFGAGVLVNTKEAGATNADGYVYIYGVRRKNKEVMVARTLPDNIVNFREWTFWDGKTWSNDPANVAAIADHASNELSVTELEDGRYIMVFQIDGMGTGIGVRLGTSPAGPFGQIIRIYDVAGDLEKDKDIFSYNAKAHPVLSRPGELLISYNVNSFDFANDIKTLPHLYHPRFLRLKYDLR
jgi:hypothetical protein